LEDIFYRRIPFYQQFLHQRGRLLSNPEQGRIAGVVIEVQPEYITVRDFRGNIGKLLPLHKALCRQTGYCFAEKKSRKRSSAKPTSVFGSTIHD
jgi:hypothetical protein